MYKLNNFLILNHHRGDIKIVTYNVAGLRAALKVFALFIYLFIIHKYVFLLKERTGGIYRKRKSGYYFASRDKS